MGCEIQPDRRLGSELSDYAKKCGASGGIFHTDELPAYGVTAEEVGAVRACMHAGDRDCVIIVAAVNDVQAACALQQVISSARVALSEKPVPGRRLRKMLEASRHSAYMRPLHGCSTDVS